MSESDDTTWLVLSTLFQILPQAPILLVFLGGFIWAVANRRRHPQVSLLATIALVLLTLNVLIMPFIYNAWIRLMIRNGEYGTLGYGTFAGVLSLGSSLLKAGAFGLLFWALFGWRKSVIPTHKRDELDRIPDLPRSVSTESAVRESRSYP